MDGEARSLWAELEGIHKKARAAVEKLGDKGVVWQPAAPETNSAAVIVSHMCGSELQWVGEYVGGVPSKRVRDTEFKTPKATKKDLLAALDRTAAASQAAISKHTSAGLDKPATGRPEFKGTLRDCVLHALTHESEHIGQLELTVQLWLAQNTR